MKDSGKCLADCGSSSMVKYLSAVSTDMYQVGDDSLHHMTLLFPEIVDFLILGMSFEQEDINRGEIRDVSISLKFLSNF